MKHNLEEMNPPVILAVDDNKDILISLELMLERNEFRVLTASNGKEALSTLNNQEPPPDLIISDIKMPGMNGYELFSTIIENEEWKEIPFIFLTALDSKKEISKGKALGVDDYLVKPFIEEDLIAVVEGKLRKRSLLKAYSSRFEDINLNFKDIQAPVSKKKTSGTFLFIMKWNQKYGARLQYVYPENNQSQSVKQLGQRLMQVAMSLKDDKQANKEIPLKRGLSVHLKPINRDAFIYFDNPGESTIYMIGVISLKLEFFDTLKLENIFREIFFKIRAGAEINFEKYWKMIYLCLHPLNA